LATSLLDQIADHLISSGIVVYPGEVGWPIYKGMFPPTPDKVVSVFETPGDPPDIIQDSPETAYDYPGFQIRIRGERYAYDEMRAKMQDIFEALHESEPAVSSSEPVFIYIYAVSSGPLPMGSDESERPELSWNFKTMRSR
jgi:hypothetical protein